MAKKKVFKDYYSIGEICKETGKSPDSVKYNVRKKNIPSPKLNISFIRFIGEHTKKYTISLWSRRQLGTIKKRYKLIYPGHYKNFRNPITKKRSVL